MDDATFVKELTDARPYLLRVAGALTRCYCVRSEPEDTVQTVCEKAWRARDTFAGRAAVRTWLVTIVRNTVADQHRRERTDALSYAGELVPEIVCRLRAPEPDTGNERGSVDWSALVSGLTPRCREAVEDVLAGRTPGKVAKCRAVAAIRERVRVGVEGTLSGSHP